MKKSILLMITLVTAGLKAQENDLFILNLLPGSDIVHVFTENNGSLTGRYGLESGDYMRASVSPEQALEIAADRRFIGSRDQLGAIEYLGTEKITRNPEDFLYVVQENFESGHTQYYGGYIPGIKIKKLSKEQAMEQFPKLLLY